MRTLALLLTCLACAGNARRMQSAAAFNPPSSGLHPAKVTPASNRHRHSKMEAGTVTEEETAPAFDVKDMAGVSAPLGYFDPFGYAVGKSEGTIRFYREVEVKHSRVAMLAAVGYLVAEKFHPLFGGNIDVPSLVAFQQTPLQTFWGLVVLVIAGLEYGSLASFKSPEDGFWAIRSDHVAGDLGFDPLGLKPKDPAAFKEMQTKELNNGRLAMIAFAGMVYQEVAHPGEKLF
mmetsp:Transcript_147921/g.260779  ORF Transcript_147921/g.260779 Transcript_147921/m.260779 type:complete len:232 (-) Transcript_147921:216-911(-)